MKPIAACILFFVVLCSNAGAQKGEDLVSCMKSFHNYMVRDHFLVDLYIDDSMSYGHSNGWVESREEFRQNLGAKLIYHSITEDSVLATIHGNYAYLRFNGDFDVTMNGNRAVYKLKVVQVWVRKKKNGGWRLFVRQAVRRPQ